MIVAFFEVALSSSLEPKYKDIFLAFQDANANVTA